MTDVIQLGPFLVKTASLLYAVAALTGYAVMGRWLKQHHPLYKKQIMELAGSGAVLGFMVWKLSYALFYPLKVWAYPASLLYFSGGERGVWLAGACVAGYVFYRMRKAQLPLKAVFPALATGVVSAWGLGHLLLGLAWRQDLLSHTAHAGLSLIVLLGITARTDRMRAGVAVLGITGLVAWGYLEQQGGPPGFSAPQDVPAAGQSQRAVGLQKGSLAPDFLLHTPDGTPVRLSDLRGNKVILNMWATWCPPCRAEMPDMQEFYEQYGAEGVTILGVNLIETEQSEAAVSAFLEKYGITFPVVLDEEKRVSRLYQGISIPTSYVIDSHGVIQQKVIGPLNVEMMEKMMSAIE